MKRSNICKTLNAGMVMLLVPCLITCKSGPDKSASKEPDATETDTLKEKVIERISGYPLPTAFEITTMLNEAGAPYILSISNAASNAGNYFTQVEKAFNLGVYGADLSYASTYMMKQETMLYLDASKQLTDEIEISSAFNQTYAERVENNLENGDSLISIISDSFIDTYNYLINNNQDKLAILVMAGSWIEGLYITTQIAITAEDNTALLDIIVHQKSSLKTLMEIMDPIKGDEDVTEISNALNELQGQYNAIEDQVSDELFEKIVSIVENIRNKIV
jgi:hypothetical protein